jgi:hypothetical protein
MERRSIRKPAMLGAAGLLALAGIGGVAHNVAVHAASPHPRTTVHASTTSGAQSDNGQADTADNGQADTADTADAAASDKSDASDATTEASSSATDPSGPCTGTGATQQGNCDTQDAPDSTSGH